MHKGSCLCGAIKFTVNGKLDSNDACHCVQCRKWSGHFLVGTEVPRSALTIQGAQHVRWYKSSEKVRRGFCSTCGASLFFDPLEQNKHDWIGVSLGSFDTPTKTKLAQHIFVAEKGDYYDITDGLPQNAR